MRQKSADRRGTALHPLYDLLQNALRNGYILRHRHRNKGRKLITYYSRRGAGDHPGQCVAGWLLGEAQGADPGLDLGVKWPGAATERGRAGRMTPLLPALGALLLCWFPRVATRWALSAKGARLATSAY